MLGLINAEREKAGVDAVVLGDNVAAQLHAEVSLESCFLSHWGIDGLKPYMRYSLAGGHQSNAENVLGAYYCTEIPDWWYKTCAAVGDLVESAGDICTRAADWWYRANDSVEQEIREAMEGWMDSPGHRRTILNPWHKKVNLGLAWNRHRVAFVQQFEGDYVEYGRPPVIDNDRLKLAGRVENGARAGGDLSIRIYYDMPPHILSRGQLLMTSCYDSGRLIAILRPPLQGNRRYTKDSVTWSYPPCLNPFRVPYDTPAPQSPAEAKQFRVVAEAAAAVVPEQSIAVQAITALEWTATGERFSVTANLSQVIAEYGKGVYTVVLWGNVDGEDVVISEYSMFEGITPTETYGRW